MSCDRFEREGLAAVESGRALDAHFDTCPDCLQARAAHERLAGLFPRVGERYAPRGDWEARVFAGVARERPARRWAGWLAGAVALLAGTAALLVVAPWREPALPMYALTVSSGEAEVRGDERPGEPPVLGPGSVVTLVLQPDAAPDGDVAAQAWAVPEGGAPRPLGAARVEMAAAGGVRVHVEGGDPALPAGPATLAVAIGRPGALPDAAAIAAALDGSAPEGWRLARAQVVVRAR